ncbi:17007_t:CDS:2, partial [Racocetra persica]
NLQLPNWSWFAFSDQNLHHIRLRNLAQKIFLVYRDALINLSYETESQSSTEGQKSYQNQKSYQKNQKLYRSKTENVRSKK